MARERAPGLARVALAFIATFVIMFLVPLIPYGTLSAVAGLEPPAPDSPGRAGSDGPA